jgi:putative transposase
MGLEAIYPKPKTSRPHPQHKVYPYLLRNLKIDRPNQVWAADIGGGPKKLDNVLSSESLQKERI